MIDLACDGLGMFLCSSQALIGSGVDGIPVVFSLEFTSSVYDFDDGIYFLGTQRRNGAKAQRGRKGIEVQRVEAQKKKQNQARRGGAPCP